jgi:hypothetical protein
MPVRNRRSVDYDDEESLCIIDKEKTKKVSAEVLIAIPVSKGSKKYIMYLGLLYTGCSSSLIDKEIVECNSFDVNFSDLKTK